MTSVYLAASWDAKDLMIMYRGQLEIVGMRVTSRWIDSPPHDKSHTPGSLENAHKGVSDLEDIDAADTLIAFTGIPSTTGGMHVEFGYALAKGKRLVIVGPYANIFHRQAHIRFETWESFRKAHLI